MTQKNFLQQGLGTPIGGSFYIEGGGVRVAGIIKKKGGGGASLNLFWVRTYARGALCVVE